MHEQLYLAVSHIYGSRFRCLNMVKMSDVNISDLKDTDLASLSKVLPNANLNTYFLTFGTSYGKTCVMDYEAYTFVFL